MNESIMILEQRVERARELLQTVRHAALATVNDDGSPHNSPVFFQYDAELKYLFWASSPESQHSKNIARTGQVFAAIYEANEGGGLYIAANNVHIAEGEELERALPILNSFRATRDKKPLGLSYFTGNSPQRMYAAEIQELSVNLSERDENGNIIKDYRQKIERGDLR